MTEEQRKKRRKEETNFGVRCECDSGNSKFMWSNMQLHADLFKCLDCGELFYKN